MSNQTIINQTNRALNTLTSGKYFESIPLDQIFSIVRNHAGEVVDVDGTPWSGILCGENETAHFSIRNFTRQLHLSWYRMPSGRYEVTVYIS